MSEGSVEERGRKNEESYILILQAKGVGNERRKETSSIFRSNDGSEAR